MTFRSRRTWVVLIVILLVIVGALLAIPYLVNLDRSRDEIARVLEQQTGKKVAIGDLRLRLLPTVGFEVREIHVANPPDFPAGELLGVERVTASVGLFALLTRRIEITSLTLDRPTLNLLVDERGHYNYESRAKDPGRQRAPSSSSLFTLGEISDIELGDAAVSYGRASRGRVTPAWRLRGVNMELGRLIMDPGRLADLEARINLKHTEIEIAGVREPVKFRSGEISAKEKQAEGKCEAALGKTVVHASFRVPDLEKPLADFELHSPEMNLTELAVLAAPTRAQSAVSPSRHKLLGRGKVAVDRVKLPPYEMTSLQAQARLYDDTVELAPVTARLYGGAISGTLAWNAQRQPSVLTLDAKIDNVDTAKLLSTGGQPSKVRGRFEANARLSAPLGGRDFISSLSGGGQFAVRDGVLTAFNMSSSLAKIAKIVTFSQGGPVNETPFSFFGGDFRLADGRIHSENLKLESPQLGASASGSAGFDGTLSYSGWATLAGNSGGGGTSGGPLGAVGKVLGTVMQQTVGRLRVPFAIRGTFANPQVLPAGLPVQEKASSQQQPSTTQEQPKQPSPTDLFNIFRKKR